MRQEAPPSGAALLRARSPAPAPPGSHSALAPSQLRPPDLSTSPLHFPLHHPVSGKQRMAAPNASTEERFDAAVKSMTKIGLRKEIVVRVLKKLLIVYYDNWEHIEADNYNALADAICDAQNPKQEGKTKRAEKKNVEPDHCNKKLKIKEHVEKPETSGESAEMPRHKNAEALKRKTIGTQLQNQSSQLVFKESKMESREYHTFETPLAVMCPTVLEPGHHSGHEDAHMISEVQHAADRKLKGVSAAHEGQMVNACSSKAVVRSDDFSTNLDVALSNDGRGKLSFSFNSSLANGFDFHMPDIELICKAMEVRCLKTYKILEPNFSFEKLLDDTCQCIIDLGSGSNGAKERSMVQMFPAIDFLSKSSLQSNQSSSSCMPRNNLTRLGSRAASGGRQNNSSNMQVIQYQLSSSVKRRYHDIHDITKGEELVRIPIVNGVEDGVLPPPFHYIQHNTTFQDAHINLSLARIGDENCCFDCFGDCLAQPLPCACATETGGEFAYTRDGLLKEEFLDACISMRREPLNHPHLYCKICPIERMKMAVNTEEPEACKGHPIQKFIKECWRKCGCTRKCGNRVVQRGITRNLQVFLTPGKKGWGLRPSENLPRGAFVCEYVGEILTNTELYERNNQKTGKVKHTYPILLNADWGTESVLKDEEALCLDGTFYGNVARFINHRCFDGNIIDIPVEIETPDHHYYHVAFFTSREVEAFEELTWDYGIDFDDVNHPVKAFKCQCGSDFCRDKRRMSRGSRGRTLMVR